MDEALDHVVSAMTGLERRNDVLAWYVVRANRFRFGRSTEKLSPEQLKQLLLALGGEETAPDAEPVVPAPPEPEQVDDASKADESESPTTPDVPGKKPKKRKRVRSMTIGPDVERNVTVVRLSREECTCALCGAEMKVFDHVDHERIRYVPAKIVIDVERREKAGCERCRKDIIVAPREQTPAVARKVDASLLAKLVAEKCVLGLPLDRQRRELARLGLDIPDKTLQSYWAYTTDLLEPIADATLSLAFGKCIVGADDSHLKTLDKGATNGIFRGHLWCFVGTDGTVGGPETIGYGYTPSWEATEITEWFSAIDGLIQCDGYAGYAREVEDKHGKNVVAVPPERRLGCGMHIRSKFHDALLAKDRRAAIPIKHFADLYQIEEDCKARSLDAEARGEARRRLSLPILDALDSWVDAIHVKLLPTSPLRRATTWRRPRGFTTATHAQPPRAPRGIPVSVPSPTAPLAAHIGRRSPSDALPLAPLRVPPSAPVKQRAQGRAHRRPGTSCVAWQYGLLGYEPQRVAASARLRLPRRAQVAGNQVQRHPTRRAWSAVR